MDPTSPYINLHQTNLEHTSACETSIFTITLQKEALKTVCFANEC